MDILCSVSLHYQGDLAAGIRALAEKEAFVATSNNIDTRLTVLETEFRTELKHLVTKADLRGLEMRQAGLIIAGLTLVVAVLRLWE